VRNKHHISSLTFGHPAALPVAYTVRRVLAPDIIFSIVKCCRRIANSCTIKLVHRRVQFKSGLFAMERTSSWLHLTTAGLLGLLYVVFSISGELQTNSPIYLIVHAKRTQSICICKRHYVIRIIAPATKDRTAFIYLFIYYVYKTSRRTRDVTNDVNVKIHVQ